MAAKRSSPVVKALIGLAVVGLAAIGTWISKGGQAGPATGSGGGHGGSSGVNAGRSGSGAEQSNAAPAKGASDGPSGTRGSTEASAARVPTSGSGQSAIRIGAWNIEWLGNASDRSGAGRDVAQRPQDLADYIVASGVDVLGVCEIVTSIPGRPIRSREVEAVLEEIASRTKQRWAYVLFPGRADGDQLTGVLWNTSTVNAVRPDNTAYRLDVDAPWAVPIPRGRSSQGSGLWNRPPHAMMFSAGAGKTDVILIVVHMKADYEGDFSAHRSEEAEALVRALPEVRKHFGDADVVIAGDTNCSAANERAIQVFAKAGFKDLNSSGQSTHWRGGAMDRVLVPVDQPEFKTSGMDVLSESYLRKRKWEPRDFKRFMSDHYLVESTIQIQPDDD